MAMKNNSLLRGKTALVTGASSGLGAEFARQLAAMGCHLILVARREARLQALRQELIARQPINVRVFPADLAEPDSPQTLYAAIKAAGLSVDILVNNAGYGIYGEHATIPWPQERQMLMLDILAVMQLTKLALPICCSVIAATSCKSALLAPINPRRPMPPTVLSKPWCCISAKRSITSYGIPA